MKGLFVGLAEFMTKLIGSTLVIVLMGAIIGLFIGSAVSVFNWIVG